MAVTIDGTANTITAAATSATALTTASGSAPSYSARAWVNFNGTGTVAIRASGNVSSITDNGTGDYSINFTTAMPDALFSVNGTGSQNNTYNCIVATNDKSYSNSTSLARILVIQVNNAPVDAAYLNIAIHR